MELSLKHGLCEQYAAKFDYVIEPPWLLAGVDGFRVGDYTGAKRAARKYADYVNAAIAAGRFSKLHRRVRRTWEQVGLEIEIFGAADLYTPAALPLKIEARKVALLPSSTRWIELQL